jgi:hypothetical protein
MRANKYGRINYGVFLRIGLGIRDLSLIARGLVSLNLVVFLIVQLGIEPKRRAVFAERVVEGVLKGVVAQNGVNDDIVAADAIIASGPHDDLEKIDSTIDLPITSDEALNQYSPPFHQLDAIIDVKFVSGLAIGMTISILTSLFIK